MTLDWTWIPIVAAALYNFVATIAMCQWAQWAFMGPRLFAWQETVNADHPDALDLVRLARSDADISEAGLRLEKLETDKYLVQIPPMAHKSRDLYVFLSLFSGKLQVDRGEGRLLFTLNLGTGPVVLILVGVGTAVYRIWSTQTAALALVALVAMGAFAVAVWVGAYVMAYRPNLGDFWFSLTSRLSSSGTAGQYPSRR